MEGQKTKREKASLKKGPIDTAQKAAPKEQIEKAIARSPPQR
jgi:hypothetical protein